MNWSLCLGLELYWNLCLEKTLERNLKKTSEKLKMNREKDLKIKHWLEKEKEKEKGKEKEKEKEKGKGKFGTDPTKN